MKAQWNKLTCACVALMLMSAVTASASTNVAARQIQYGFTVQNSRGDVLPLAELWVYGPAARSDSQVCRAIRSSHPHQLITDALGNQILHFSFTNLPPYAVKIITIEADVDLLKPTAIAEKSNDTKAEWLKPERLVEFEDSEFIRLVPSLGGTTRTTKAEAIHAWIIGNVKDGGYSAKDRGALYALREKQGDCTEFMYLFVALCRRAQIPARGMGGYVCSKSMILRPMDYHNWAEFYDGSRWQIADPYRKVFIPHEPDYVATRVIGAAEGPMGDFPRYHFQGEGLKVELN